MIVAAEVDRRTGQDAADRLAREFAASGLPRVYASGERMLGHLPDCTAAARAVAQLLGSDVPGLLLHGPAGSYKTSLACAFLAAQIRTGASGRYVFVPDLFSDIHASYNGSGLSRDAIVAPLVSTPRLVLDDLGKEKPSEHAASVVFEILDGRYRRQGPGRWTIVISNQALDALCDRFAHLGEEVANPIRRRLSELTIAVPMSRGAA